MQSLDVASVTLIAGTGLAAGLVNAIAGGGSLISFPALVAVGLPAVTANITNTVALCPGYLGGAFAHDFLSLSLPLGETHAQAAVRAKEWVGERMKVRDFFVVCCGQARLEIPKPKLQVPSKLQSSNDQTLSFGLRHSATSACARRRFKSG